ncbi:aspartyl/glutamyl-tRNA(Asn/Gln) amidotransferase, B subunit [Cladophialophora bantiana CBS 173.52]|uniref:Glutamyl-tRNA(Gln) amidotransferase subunit B, mitochondrial n=1 Tax=Cladophialophora bantiana (strain ATCC 10958 / CBS 173.52 / CDC B-1940 / NIH 8579) TaxID=1442370 RepID=A0A0D2H746_CLAB1|nr:aspartyl/glutamyl-tRNA(Asn/Gln) amidotransferase, B subunit [Cladophialophora bantiana CBS 173.52]KIW89108.1 aspartyl/glutamyl-tRNA(Asn/Gln) amidotransferase, B subunit [Cladophialophora bantiana CBS 173.52]
MHQRWLRWTRQRLPVRPLTTSGLPDFAPTSPARCNPQAVSHGFHSSVPRPKQDHGPLRKQLKDAVKATRTLPRAPAAAENPDILADWELTVGIEIHAQLNASRKLFSPGITAPTTVPNSQVAPFDIALPGSLPVLQPAVILPALRAATALDCTIQQVSTFDRKHYFYHDQPAGYQITQYYNPFAKNGRVVLTAEDGLDEGRTVTVNIKQVQLEQDTARTQEDDSNTALIDFNRCGQALIEIISLPDLHSPRDAAIYVKKIQLLLYAVDAVTTGMEQGGLRADVNVSVRRRGGEEGPFAYSGVTGLGQRTEIKNLSTFKGIEDAIKAERDRQIRILESGSPVLGETRGWSMTSPNETKRLRGKEGEVDYRYMPDADIPPLYISTDLISWIQKTLPPTTSELVEILVQEYRLSFTDAMTLVSLDDGERLIYFQEVVDELVSSSRFTTTPKDHGKTVGNWVLHELGALISTEERQWSDNPVSSKSMAEIIYRLKDNQITGSSAKQILKLIYNGDKRTISHLIKQEELGFSEMSTETYQAIAKEIVEQFPQHVKDIVEKGKIGKLQFLMGQMMRHPRRGDMRPPEAEKALRQLILGSRG